MLVEFVESCEIEICNNLDEFDNAETETEIFRVGDQAEFDIIDHPSKFNGEEDLEHVNVQFGDGSVAFGLSVNWYKIISE